MFLSATTSNITLGQAGIYALLGYGVVFFGLILLMIVVVLFGKVFAEKKKSAAVTQEVPAVPAAPAEAPGSAGQLKLHNVEPKIAAMLMAIVADKLQKPVNELRFISIKEVDK